MIWDEFLRHFRFCDEEDSGLSDEEQERKGPKNRPKHTRKQIHQAKKNFLEKFKTASYTSHSITLCILYMPRSRDDAHIVSTETVRNVSKKKTKHVF
ncbi:hypothetical protein QVO10_10280 [Bacteroides gallinaceum]|uniref:Uncharacterized protein n=3 Tax=Bacteroidaceae TaxID=815 RepID=A0ABT7X6Q5_9BACE|nr:MULTISPECIES: hypothetical protein [Bacteroidaceae]MBD8039415.1 hypothetical protein [Phocaeicola intestinalis]MBM6719035.1 hypothetical protein [Bacteroides gallinaceum]MDN0049767.1 hypothetical protein [Bacteroides gallinaceum]MDN0077878.1 hypothetical protein [Bacteroides gallinaceum]